MSSLETERDRDRKRGAGGGGGGGRGQFCLAYNCRLITKVELAGIFQGINCLLTGRSKKNHRVGWQKYCFLSFCSIPLGAEGHNEVQFESEVV